MLLGYSLDKCLHLFGKGPSKIAAAQQPRGAPTKEGSRRSYKWNELSRSGHKGKYIVDFSGT